MKMKGSKVTWSGRRLKGREIYRMRFGGKGLSLNLCRRVESSAGRESKKKMSGKRTRPCLFLTRLKCAGVLMVVLCVCFLHFVWVCLCFMMTGPTQSSTLPSIHSNTLVSVCVCVLPNILLYIYCISTVYLLGSGKGRVYLLYIFKAAEIKFINRGRKINGAIFAWKP